MIRTGTLKDNKGFSIIELMVVLVIVAILAGFGLPEYGRFAAKNRVRGAATGLMQHMRLVRTMAIKENRTYIITINASTNNSYDMGFDGNGNNDLGEPNFDFYGDGAPVRRILVQSEYGINVVLGEGNFVITPPNGPNGVGISGQSVLFFMPDSSSSPNGMIYFQETGRGYTFAVELANTAGKTNLFMWRGDEDNLSETEWTELR